MNRPIIKFIADFGPLLIFFTIYFKGDNNLKAAIPPFVIATLISLLVMYFLEKRIPMVPLTSGILITLFGGLTLYFNNKIFFYMKPTIINLLFAGVIFFGKYLTKKHLLKIFFQNAFKLEDEGWKNQTERCKDAPRRQRKGHSGKEKSAPLSVVRTIWQKRLREWSLQPARILPYSYD